jgi:hypothetical protein
MNTHRWFSLDINNLSQYHPSVCAQSVFAIKPIPKGDIIYVKESIEIPAILPSSHGCSIEIIPDYQYRNYCIYNSSLQLIYEINNQQGLIIWEHTLRVGGRHISYSQILKK